MKLWQLSFVISKDGRVTDPRTVRNPGLGTGEAALKVIERMIADDIRWVPGKMGNKTVPVQYNLPVRFGSSILQKETGNKFR